MPFSMEYINIKYKHKTYKYVGFSPVTVRSETFTSFT